MPSYSDGTVPFGAQVVTIGATADIAENISYTEPATVIERRDSVGNPSAQVFVAGFGSGSATLQHALTGTVVPTIGATFTLTRNDGTTIGCAVNNTSEAQAQLDHKKTNVNFRRRYNG